MREALPRPRSALLFALGALALALSACARVPQLDAVDPAYLIQPIDLDGPEEPLPASLDQVNRMTAGRSAMVLLRDGRARDVKSLRVGRDSARYVVVPGAWEERMPTRGISVIRFSRVHRGKGAFQGGRLGFILAAIVGPLGEYWAGSPMRSIGLSVPVYGLMGLAVGASVGAVAGIPETFHYAPAPPGQAAALEGDD